MILVIDNYDSFVHNLARYFRLCGHNTIIRKSDEITPQEIQMIQPSHIVISPGPLSPTEAGQSLAIIQAYYQTVPILGVCLGHQAIGQVFGGKITQANTPRHGQSLMLKHTGDGLFHNIPSPLQVGLYHSLVIDPKTLSPAFRIDACSPEGDIMAISHRDYPVYGLQFHPESILTQQGLPLIQNFIQSG